MKILLLNANLAGCGTYYRALWFGKLLAKHRGHDVTLCTVSRNLKWNRNSFSSSGINISEGPNWGYKFIPGYGSNWLDIAWRWKQIKFGNFDIIYAFEYHPNVSWPINLGINKNQLFLSDWCDWYSGAANVFKGNKLAHRWDKLREEKIRLKADKVSVISSVLEKRALEIGVQNQNVYLIREGVDTTFMKPYDKTRAREKLNIPTNLKLIGTLTDGHSFPFLVKAFKYVKNNLSDARLLFVGAPSENQKKLIANSGLNDFFFYTGRCSDEELPVFLAAADVFALPMQNTIANAARFPHKIGDYLACGRPVITTNVGDYPNLLKKNNVAIVTDNLIDFPNKLLNLIKNNDQIDYYSEVGRKWVEEKLDWEIIAPDIINFVEM